jgi:hypothetical protein
VFRKERTCGLVGTSKKHFKEWFSGKAEGLQVLHVQHSSFSSARNVRYIKQRPLKAWIQIKYNGKELFSKKLN